MTKNFAFDDYTVINKQNIEIFFSLVVFLSYSFILVFANSIVIIVSSSDVFATRVVSHQQEQKWWQFSYIYKSALICRVKKSLVVEQNVSLVIPFYHLRNGRRQHSWKCFRMYCTLCSVVSHHNLIWSKQSSIFFCFLASRRSSIGWRW
jgi:hypothetical protein